MVNSKMEKKKETSSNKKENKDNNKASVLSKLDHGPKLFSGLKLTVFLFIPISLHYLGKENN